MIGITGIFILLISFLQVVSPFTPEVEGDRFRCQRRNGKFPKPGSLCQSYYECRNWNPKVKVCPQDQHFFPAKGYCVWADNYPCLEKPKFKECPLPYGKFLKPGTGCKVYYDCCRGRPTEKKCAEGTLFNHAREKCDWPEYVTCYEDTSTTKSSSQSTSTLSISSTLVIKSTTKKALTILPDIVTTDSDEDSSSTESGSSEEGNSSEENRQSSTKSEIMSTVISSTHIDDYTESTEGKNTESSSTVENSSRGTTSTLAPDDSSTIFEISTASFTDDYVPKTTTYPEVITGDTRSEATYTIENKDDYSKTITPGLTEEPVTPHIFCPKPNGYFPHPYDKHKFISCSRGNPTIMNCPEDLVYDHKKRSCEYNT